MSDHDTSTRAKLTYPPPVATLHLDLQEGFSGEEVGIAIDGEERLRREVRTRRVLSLASHDTFDVQDGPHVVVVSIPERGIEKRIEVEVKGDVYVGLGLRDEGDLRVRVQDTRFGYG